MKNTIVVDLDGTLSDGRARYHLVAGKKRDYPAFHALLGEDPVNEWCRDLVRGMAQLGKRIALVSARPAYCEASTRAWLEKHEIPFHALHLLRAGDEDNTPDQELKRAWLQGYGKDRVLFVVDDRQKVVDMWRAEGMTVLQCAAWEEDKKSRDQYAAIETIGLIIGASGNTDGEKVAGVRRVLAWGAK